MVTSANSRAAGQSTPLTDTDLIKCGLPFASFNPYPISYDFPYPISDLNLNVAYEYDRFWHNHMSIKSSSLRRIQTKHQYIYSDYCIIIPVWERAGNKTAYWTSLRLVSIRHHGRANSSANVVPSLYNPFGKSGFLTILTVISHTAIFVIVGADIGFEQSNNAVALFHLGDQGTGACHMLFSWYSWLIILNHYW